jgi:hypothetical protein
MRNSTLSLVGQWPDRTLGQDGDRPKGGVTRCGSFLVQAAFVLWIPCTFVCIALFCLPSGTVSGGATLGPTWAMARPGFGHNFDFLVGPA